MSAPRRVLPDFLIIGAQKRGTGSLFRYIARHPEVAAPLIKEIHYFNRYYPLGPLWYRHHFPTVEELESLGEGRRRVTFEATPGYLPHPMAPRRIASDVPDARLVVLVRNPIDRAYSHYKQRIRFGWETRTFEDAVVEELELLKRARGADARLIQCGYLSRGLYAVQLDFWLEFTPRENILVINSETFFQNPNQEYQRVLAFLGLAEHVLPSYENRNPGQASAQPKPEIIELLNQFYRVSNERLSDLLGQGQGWSA